MCFSLKFTKFVKNHPMIDSITFSNYKLFKSQQTLRLKPITVVIGKNNFGKSALLKLPIIIATIRMPLMLLQSIYLIN